MIGAAVDTTSKLVAAQSDTQWEHDDVIIDADRASVKQVDPMKSQRRPKSPGKIL